MSVTDLINWIGTGLFTLYFVAGLVSAAMEISRRIWRGLRKG